MLKRTVHLWLVSFTLFAGHAFGFDLPTGVTVGPSVAGITEYRLTNGLKVLLFPDASQAKITVNMTYRVGSRHEGYGDTGSAHLLEHMLFKGSPKFPKLDDEFTQRGASHNATTRTDITNYFEVLTATEDNLRFAIKLEADRMVNAYLRKDDLDKEFTVVRNEFERGENEPGQVTAKRLFAVAYDWHNYGKLPIGNRGDIENVDIERLRAFYRTYYQPDNAVLLVAGKFDPAFALTTIAAEFGVIAKPTRLLPTVNTVEPTQDGERNVTVRRKGDIQIVMAGYKVPGSLHPDATAIDFAIAILGNVPSGRLHKRLVEGKLAVGVGAQSLSYLDPFPAIMMAVQKAGESIDATRDALLQEVEAFAKAPPTEDEMARTMRAFDNAFEAMLANPERIGLMLSSPIGLGDWRISFWARDEIKKITAADVQRVAAKYFVRDNRTVATFLPENTPLRADIEAAPLASAVLANWTPSAQLAAVSQGEAFESTAKQIDARTRIVQIGGLKVALLPKKTRGETVRVRISLAAGDETSLTGRAELLSLANGTVSLGTTKYSRSALADELQKHKMRGGVLAFETTRGEIVNAIALAAHVLRQPTFPETELEQIRKQALAGLELSRSDPGALAGERMTQHFNAYPVGHPRYPMTRAESEVFVRNFKREQVASAYADFVGASNGLVAIVGDFDAKAVTHALAEGFAPWTNKLPYTRLTARRISPPAINEWIHTPDKESGVFQARIAFALKRDDPDYPALWVANMILGASGLDSRIAARIRGKEGLSYGIGSALTMGVRSSAASWSVGGTAAPQNINTVEKVVLEEIDRARDGGFSAAEVEKVRSAIRGHYDADYANDTAVAGMWMDRLDRDLTFADYETFVAKVQAVTPEAAQAALRKYIDPTALSIVKAGDKSKVK